MQGLTPGAISGWDDFMATLHKVPAQAKVGDLDRLNTVCATLCKHLQSMISSSAHLGLISNFSGYNRGTDGVISLCDINLMWFCRPLQNWDCNSRSM